MPSAESAPGNFGTSTCEIPRAAARSQACSPPAPPRRRGGAAGGPPAGAAEAHERIVARVVPALDRDDADGALHGRVGHRQDAGGERLDRAEAAGGGGAGAPHARAAPPPALISPQGKGSGRW